MPKFFVHQNQKEEDKIIILGEDVNHIKNVLRLTRNNYIIICVIEEKNNYNSKIISIEKDKIECEIIEQLIGTTEPHIYIHLFQGLPKAEKMEWIIEKGTEIGISEFTPVNMKRCVAKLDKKNEIKKQERWQKISEMAAKQSGRDFIPKVNDIISINDILTMKDNYDIILIAYEQEKEKTLKQQLKQSQKKNIKIAVIVGPEGGIDEQEIKILQQINSNLITLGKRILRTETAPLVLASNILYEFEM